jgi:hypothetical protein
MAQRFGLVFAALSAAPHPCLVVGAKMACAEAFYSCSVQNGTYAVGSRPCQSLCNDTATQCANFLKRRVDGLAVSLRARLIARDGWRRAVWAIRWIAYPRTRTATLRFRPRARRTSCQREARRKARIRSDPIRSNPTVLAPANVR